MNCIQYQHPGNQPENFSIVTERVWMDRQHINVLKNCKTFIYYVNCYCFLLLFLINHTFLYDSHCMKLYQLATL